MKVSFFAVMLLLLLGSGCGSVSPMLSIEGISYGIQPYHDLPAPQGFEFDDSAKSWAYRLYEDSALNLRCCVLRYEGNSDVGQMANWYVSQMLVHDWVKTSDNKDTAGRRATLVFSKENEEAVIDIVRELNSRRLEPYTIVTITLGAKPK